MTASISQDKWKKTRVHQYAPSEHSAKLKAMKQANSPEQSDRARKNWKKAKTSITCARAFESGGKDHARKRQASFETLPSLDGPKKGGKGVIMATRSSVEAGKLRGYDQRRIDVSTGGGTGKRPKGPEDVGDASRERQLVSAAQKHIREHAGPRAIGASSTRQRLRLTIEPRESTMITNHIIIGDRENARDSLKLQQLGVTHVLNACTQLPNYHPQLFMYRKLDILDHPDARITDHAKDASSFIARAESMNGRVLVHCIAGVSRSVSLVLMHLMACHHVPLKEAYDHVLRHRPHMRPNDGFKLQLAKFEVAHLGCSSVAAPSSGKVWDFYGWNAMRSTVPRDQSGGSRAGGGSAACLVQ